MAKQQTAVVCGRLCTAPQGDYFVTCSFDSNHVLLRSRMPYHITKCVKQHPGHNKVQCPFDSTEYIDIDEFQDHVTRSCESKRSMYSEKYETARLKETGNMGHIKQTPFFHESAPQPDEEWGGAAVEEVDDFTYTHMGVGRGISLKKKSVPKKGVGRAELLERILNDYKKKHSSGSSEASSSSEKQSVVRENIAAGQFDDN